MAGLTQLHGAAFDAWNCLLEGALSAHHRRLDLKGHAPPDQGDGAFEWRIAPRGVLVGPIPGGRT